VIAAKNEQTRSGRIPAFRPQAGAQFPSFDGVSVSATFNVRGLSLPDQTRLVGGAILIGCSYLFIAQW
jgi:hypothetical protein